MLPHVRAHHLIVHLVFKQCGLSAALEDVIEPLIAKLRHVQLRYRVQFIPSQNFKEVLPEHPYRSTVTSEVVVRADDQIMFGLRIVFVMLLEVIEGASGSSEIIAGC